MGKRQAFVGFEVLRHADVAWGVHHFSISALPSTVGNIRESMRSSGVQHFLEFTDFFPYFSCFQHEGQWKISIKDPRVGGLRGRRVFFVFFRFYRASHDTVSCFSVILFPGSL